MNLKVQISTIQISNYISEFQNVEEKKLRIKKKSVFSNLGLKLSQLKLSI